MVMAVNPHILRLTRIFRDSEPGGQTDRNGMSIWSQLVRFPFLNMLELSRKMRVSHSDGGTHIIILWMSYLTLLVANAWDENNCTSSAIRMWGFTPGGPSS
jgi:hypothetical protein